MIDVVVVGGGFAGLSAALYVARARRAVTVLDAGEPRNRFARHSHGFLGHDGRPPLEILAEARTQLLRYPTARYEALTVDRVERTDRGFRLFSDGVEVAAARRLVLATGVVDRLPAIPGLAERWGEGVMHCPYCHGYEVAGRRLGVVATGEASMHQAMLIPDWSDDVTLFTNGAITLGTDRRASLLRRGVKIVERPIAAVHGADRTVRSVDLTDGETIPIEGLFVAPETTLHSALVRQLECAVEEGVVGAMVTTDDRNRTSTPGVFAAGDMMRSIHSTTSAAAEGVVAGVAAHQSLID